MMSALKTGWVLGPLTTEAQLRRMDLEPQWVAAVDGGLRVVRKLKLIPDVSIGDWDSLGRTPKAHETKRTTTLSVEKDESDLAAALGVVPKNLKICVSGVLGGPRDDHHLASLLEMSRAAKNLKIRALTDDQDYYFLSVNCRRLRLDLSEPKQISAFSLTGGAVVARTSGLAYPLPLHIKFGTSSLGLSNYSVKDSVTIEVNRGSLIVMVKTKYAKGNRTLNHSCRRKTLWSLT